MIRRRLGMQALRQLRGGSAARVSSRRHNPLGLWRPAGARRNRSCGDDASTAIPRWWMREVGLPSAVRSTRCCRRDECGGLRRLFMLQVHKELQYIEQTLPDIERLCLYYSTIGRCDDLKENLLLAIADRAFFDDQQRRQVRTARCLCRIAPKPAWRRLRRRGGRSQCSRRRRSWKPITALDLALSADFPPLWTRFDSGHARPACTPGLSRLRRSHAVSLGCGTCRDICKGSTCG